MCILPNEYIENKTNEEIVNEITRILTQDLNNKQHIEIKSLTANEIVEEINKILKGDD